MKKIGFINGLSIREQKAIAVWYRIALAGACLMFIGMCAVNVWQLYVINNVKKECHLLQNLDTCADATMKDYKSKAELYAYQEAYCAHSADLQLSLKRIMSFLDLLVVLQSTDRELSSAGLSNLQCNIALACVNYGVALRAMDVINRHPCIATASLQSLTSGGDAQKNNTVAVIRGTVKP